MYDCQSQIEGSVTNQLKMGSKRWKKSKDKIEEAMVNSYGENRIHWTQKVAPPSGCTHYVIVDGVCKNPKTKKWDRQPEVASTLQKNLVEAFANTLPSIAFCAMNHGDGFNNLVHLSNYVTGGMPLLLLDNRREHKSFAHEVEKRMINMDRERKRLRVATKETEPEDSMKNMGSVMDTKQQKSIKLREKERAAKREREKAAKEKDKEKEQTTREILRMAKLRLVKLEGDLKRKSKVNVYHASTWSFLHSALQLCFEKRADTWEQNYDGKSIWKVLSLHREHEAKVSGGVAERALEGKRENAPEQRALI